MLRAYILIQTEPGAAAVSTHVAKVKGVVAADDVNGPYDVIAVAEVRGLDDLARSVLKIQDVARITRTLTCPVVRL